MRIKQILSVIIIIMILMSVCNGCQKEPIEEPEVLFEDEVFQEMFDAARYKDHNIMLPTQSQLDMMTALILHFSEDKECDLKDLSKFPNLRGLLIDGASDTEILQISELQQLKALEIGATDISADMSPIGKMKNIKALVISAPGIDAGVLDWSFIEEMEQLETIYIESISLKDLDFLKSLSNLERLHISDVMIEDISALKALTGLKYLYISRDDGNDYSQVLSELRGLEQISLDQCKNISNLSFLKSMPELQWISLREMGTVNLKEYVTLESHPKLSILNLDSMSEQENSAYLEEITPILEERQKENEVKTKFYDKRINFPVLLEYMEPVETYDD